MSTPDFSKAQLAALCRLADARYYAWLARGVRREQVRRIAELEKQKISSGRALEALRITQEYLSGAVQEWISIYEAVVREKNSPQMLSGPFVGELQQRIGRSVGTTLSSLRHRTTRAASAVGFPQSSLPPELRYADTHAEILDGVNAELARLEAEGNAPPGFSGRLTGTPVGPAATVDPANEIATPGAAAFTSQYEGLTAEASEVDRRLIPQLRPVDYSGTSVPSSQPATLSHPRVANRASGVGRTLASGDSSKIPGHANVAPQVLNAGKRQRRGRPPDQQRRDAIHNALNKHGDAWREHLKEIFSELDRQELPLGGFEGRKIDLGEDKSVRAWTWTQLDFTTGEQRRKIVDTLRKYAD